MAKFTPSNVADGEDVAPPFQFGYPNGKSYALNLWHNILFTTTSQGCAGNPNQMWAVNVTDPEKKVMTLNPKSGGLWGRTGAADRFHRHRMGAHRRRPLRTGEPGLRQRPDRRDACEGGELKMKDWLSRPTGGGCRSAISTCR